MVYGKAHSHARRNIPGVPYLLKVCPDGNGKIEKDMVQNVENCHDNPGFHRGVGQENDYEARIFKGKDLSLAEPDNGLSDHGAQKIIY